MNATYLLMVTPEGNHNKFYRMLPNFPNDSHFTVEWGRVGATAIKKIYSMAAWDKIYKDKITKGYVDQSDLHDCVVTVLSESNYAPIADQLVAELVDALLAYSDNAIKKNYIVSSKDVTQAMIDLAREKIDQLYSVTSLSEVNAILSQLFTIIPRKFVITSQKVCCPDRRYVWTRIIFCSKSKKIHRLQLIKRKLLVWWNVINRIFSCLQSSL